MATSSDGIRRNPLVLTPAAEVRGKSFPHNFKPKRHRAKKAKKKDTSDPHYEVSLGTESDDFSGNDPDPDWWMRTPRSELQRERDTRASSVTLRHGRSPPPGFERQNPQHNPKRSRNASRKHSVDKKDL